VPPIDTNGTARRSNSITAADSTESQQLVQSLKNKIADQEEQIQTLIKKRRDDVEKMKELERTKLQLDQVRARRTKILHWCYIVVTIVQTGSTRTFERTER
jgi:TolA-binding protein